MTEFRSKAEEFVTFFLDYMYNADIKDELNRRTQKMERSAGVQDLLRRAEGVFPQRAKDGKAETDKLKAEQVDKAIAESANVLDTREMFARKVAKNGGTHQLLRDLYAGHPEARERVADFLAAEDGEKDFASKE